MTSLLQYLQFGVFETCSQRSAAFELDNLI